MTDKILMSDAQARMIYYDCILENDVTDFEFFMDVMHNKNYIEKSDLELAKERWDKVNPLSENAWRFGSEYIRELESEIERLKCK